MRSALRQLAARLGRDGDDQHLVELGLVIALAVIATVLALVFLADPIADLVSLIGGRADPGG